MAQELKSLRLRQMDALLGPWLPLRSTRPPSGGWVQAIREALGMTTTQLGQRLGVTRQAVADLERREGERTVTLAALEKAAEAMGATLVYALVPKESLAATREAQADEAVDRDLRRVRHSMVLEAQDVSDEEYARQRMDAKERLLRSWSRKLWDAEEPSPGT
jgi:predicted DNA-binding mobile mystery protein A